MIPGRWTDSAAWPGEAMTTASTPVRDPNRLRGGWEELVMGLEGDDVETRATAARWRASANESPLPKRSRPGGARRTKLEIT